MRGRARNAWSVAGLLLLVAGALTATSYLVHWGPCFDAVSQACTQRRESWLTPPYMSDPADRVPWVTGPAAVASLLAGLAWPVTMRALTLGRVGRALGLVVAAQTVSIGLWSVLSAFTPLIDPELPIPTLWWLGGEVVAGALLLGMVLASADEERVPLRLVWPALALVGATTFGMLRWCAELLAFGGHLGEGVPRPGAGFGLAATLVLAGGALLVRGLLPAPRPRSAGARLRAQL